MPYLLFLKKQQNLKLSSAAIIGGALRVNIDLRCEYGPRRDKTCLQGFQQSKIQTSLLSYRD